MRVPSLAGCKSYIRGTQKLVVSVLSQHTHGCERPAASTCTWTRSRNTTAPSPFSAKYLWIQWNQLLLVPVLVCVCVCGCFNPLFVSILDRLDMVVVFSGLAAYVPGMAGAPLSMLRTFRILRPLRSLRATPTLRQIVEALLGSIPGIVNVLILQTMLFVLFAVLGLQVSFCVKCEGASTANRSWYPRCFHLYPLRRYVLYLVQYLVFPVYLRVCPTLYRR